MHPQGPLRWHESIVYYRAAGPSRLDDFGRRCHLRTAYGIHIILGPRFALHRASGRHLWPRTSLFGLSQCTGVVSSALICAEVRCEFALSGFSKASRQSFLGPGCRSRGVGRRRRWRLGSAALPRRRSAPRGRAIEPPRTPQKFVRRSKQRIHPDVREGHAARSRLGPIWTGEQRSPLHAPPRRAHTGPELVRGYFPIREAGLLCYAIRAAAASSSRKPR
jgi:hypothetical protein